jgi:pyridoxine 4-dehydrogenase
VPPKLIHPSLNQKCSAALKEGRCRSADLSFRRIAGSESEASVKESSGICNHHDINKLDVVNLRVGGLLAPSEGSIEEPLTALVELKRQGLIRHIGLSNVSPQQFAEAQKISEIVCVQNAYNVAHRDDDAFIDDLAKQGVAYVPFFPLGGFTPLQASALDAVAASLHATPMQVALAWLLQRSPNILLIPGTSSPQHLRENLSAATLKLPREVIAKLDSIESSWAERLMAMVQAQPNH